MSIHLIRVFDVADSQETKLVSAVAACRVDWKQNWKGYETARKANVSQNFEISNKEESVNRGVVKNECVGYPEKGHNPVEYAIW